MNVEIDFPRPPRTKRPDVKQMAVEQAAADRMYREYILGFEAFQSIIEGSGQFVIYHPASQADSADLPTTH